MKRITTTILQAALCVLPSLAAMYAATAAPIKLATAPLETSSVEQVLPNVFFVLDDSGSMGWDYLPDWANSGTTSLFRNSGYNGIYYNPRTTYTPPMKYDGTGYPSMTSAYTSGWTSVPNDGFGIQSSSNDDLTGSARYYVFTLGEYCTDIGLRSCQAQTAPGSGYTIPAGLRWCTDGNLNDCQATRIDSGAKTFTRARYPGQTSGSISVPGQNKRTDVTSNTATYPQGGTRTDCVSTTSCTYDEEMTNYANWWAYYHTRMQMTKTAATLGFSVVTDSVRLGYMSINNSTGSDFLDIDNATTTTGGQKSKWYDKLVKAVPNSSTPLRVALASAGNYYAGKDARINGQTPKDPIQYACQKHYTLLSTDGYWNESSTPKGISGSSIGDVDGAAGVVRPYLDGNKTSNSLSDVAQYYYVNDIRSTAFSNTTNPKGDDVSNNDTKNGPQRMLTSTIGLGVSGFMQYQADYATATSGDYFDVLKGTNASSTRCRWQESGTTCNWPEPESNKQTTVDDLWHAAVNGRGTYFSAGDPVSLRDGLRTFLNTVNVEVGAGAAVTPSTANVTSADNFLFDSSFWSGQWTGELARYTIDPDTGLARGVPDWTQSGTADTTSTTKPTPLLDRRVYTDRKIYTFNGSTGMISFDWGSLSDMQKYFKVDAIKSLSQMCPAGINCVPTAQQIDSTTAGSVTGMGGINLVNFLRGDRTNERGAGGSYYNKREHILGDIVGSQSAYVKKSNFSYLDAGYADFKAANNTRQGMVYVGSNDGMLHAFNADDGAESWAYIPSMLVPNLYKLADKDYNSKHQYFVNGSPQQGDAYFGDKWHTILVGGLAAGGRGYYALDVTQPDAPKVLWEFTSDTSKGAPYVTDADLGYTYGIPIITKLPDGTWVVLVTSGYNNVEPGDGRGYLWVLDAQTGKIISKISTGVGSATAAMPGCTVAPCPSGLSRISAWMDNVNLNNTLTQVYGGDMYGNVWRFDLRKLTATGGTATVQLLTTLFDGSANRQPITSWIELGFANNSHIVFVGTGSYLSVSDIGDKQVQSVYAIKDPLTGSDPTTPLYSNPRSNACSATVKTNCFMKQVMTNSTDGKTRTVTSSSSYATDLGLMNGWFIDLPTGGERINADSTLQLGILLFVSNIPNSGNACGSGGSGFLNYLDYKTGLPLRTEPNRIVGVLLAGGAGMGSAPAVTATKDGKLRATIKLSTGVTVTQNLPPPPGGLKTRRVSWRELANR